MWNFLAPPAFKPEQTGSEADERYRRLRWQVFIGIFIGYAGFGSPDKPGGLCI